MLTQIIFSNQSTGDAAAAPCLLWRVPGFAGVVLACTLAVAGCKTEGSGEKPAGLDPTAQTQATSVANEAPAPAANVAGGEAEVVPDAPDPAQSITGTITLADAHKAAVKAGETMWLVVRPGGGRQGPPMAIQRMQVGDFPLEYSVSGRDAMIKGMPFAGEVDITVRVDKDGNPMRYAKGEVFGTVSNVKVGSAQVEIRLDQVQEDDTTLGGPSGPAHGQKPPGHP